MSLIVEIFATLAPLPILVASIIGVTKFGAASKAERHLIVLLVLSFIAQLLATIFWWEQINNLAISHILTPIEFLLIARYYSFFVSNQWRMVLNVFIVGFFALASFDFFFHDSFIEMNSFVKGVECILLIGISLLMWMKIMRELAIKNLLSMTLFWVNSAVLIYFSANCMLFFYSEFILSNMKHIGLVLWGMHLFFMTLYYIFMSIGVWKIQQK